ncbi:MAG: glutamine synthetase III [Oscillospiraceae bacterium]
MTNLPELFGTMAFNETAMKQYLSEDVYTTLKRTIDSGAPLNIDIANAVANGMKEWAVSKGVTHFTHWFQPHTGVTAEKHESFISPDGSGGVIMEFSGKELIKGEADGSSFPSGGLRATFEARGYTAWDPTSYAFIKDGVLCIPTAFCSYGGQALDKKTPLLRSMDALNTQAMRIMKLFGTDCGRVFPTVGLEQEYFLIDRDRYNQRKDLIYTGRTLLGARPPKGQELDDHYYGSIKLRVSAFMKELNEELWKLGILAKTEHNEAAPAQHELAPIFCKCNIAVDHNQITMEVMKKVAKRHNLTCLLHEKPFAGVNGSGKHNNWGLSTDTGVNLFSPGRTPNDNARFLTMVCAVIKAVDDYQDLLRFSVSGAGNDNRLGGYEAPPAIISMCLGADLEGILASFAEGKGYGQRRQEMLKIGVDALPDIPKDTTDRNRTSPFAFTGNKFEFRSLGSSMSAADCNTVLNTIVAESLRIFADILESADDFNAALEKLIKITLNKHWRIIFSGNGYSQEWVEEARRRGLSNYPSSAEAIPHLLDKKNVELFERHKVFRRDELSAVAEILLENYCKEINIEACVMSEMVRRDIVPAVIRYSSMIAQSISLKESVSGYHKFSHRAENQLLDRVSTLCDELYSRCGELDKAIEDAAAIGDMARRALCYRENVMAKMAQVRTVSDTLETMVSKEAWPYPSYGSLIYRV